MKYAIIVLVALIYLSCSKSGSISPVQPPPKDTTVVTPPKDTATAPPKDTTTALPKDTTKAPPKDTTTNSLTYRTMVVPYGTLIFLDSTTGGRTFINYADGILDVEKLDNYLPQYQKAELSSYNEGTINVRPDSTIPGDQLVTFSTLSPRAAYSASAPLSDTAVYYNLRVRQGNLVTVIFPNQASVIRYRNLNHTVTLADVKAANNQSIYVELNYYGTY